MEPAGSSGVTQSRRKPMRGPPRRKVGHLESSREWGGSRNLLKNHKSLALDLIATESGEERDRELTRCGRPERHVDRCS